MAEGGKEGGIVIPGTLAQMPATVRETDSVGLGLIGVCTRQKQREEEKRRLATWEAEAVCG